MTNIEIIDFITFYGVDIAVLGIITCAFTQIFKTTLLKNASNKLYAFLPIIIGIVLYAVYSMIANLNFCYAFENLAYVIERGFTVGAAATIIYTICEQLSRGNVSLPTVTNVVEAIVADYVEAEKVSVVAQKIVDEFDCSDLKSAAEWIAATLCKYAPGEAATEDFAAISLLIAQTLARIKRTAS